MELRILAVAMWWETRYGTGAAQPGLFEHKCHRGFCHCSTERMPAWWVSRPAAEEIGRRGNVITLGTTPLTGGNRAYLVTATDLPPANYAPQTPAGWAEFYRFGQCSGQSDPVQHGLSG